MNLPLRIARRYLFAKKSTNAINIISGISVLGITVGTAAIILILSVFNGFGDLLHSLYGAFNPDIKVTIAEGKVFSPDEEQIAAIKALESVETVSKTIEEVAFFEYGKSQDFGIIKGVDDAFDTVTGVDEALIRGEYTLMDEDNDYAILGAGVEYRLSITVGDPNGLLGVYMPKRKRTIGSVKQAFKQQFLYPLGVFAIQQEFDERYVITSLDFTQELLSYDDEIDALEIKLTPTANENKAVRDIQAIIGDDFEVKTRYQQEEAFFKLMNLEKWMAYAVFSFALLLVAFNIVGALWMLVLEKRKDIAILKSMGADDDLVRNIFLFEGILLTFFGIILGFVVALGMYGLQKSFGIVRLQGGANLLINSYPISLQLNDFILVFVTVLIIGVIAALLPAWRTYRIKPVMKET